MQLYHYCAATMSVSRNVSVLQIQKSPYRLYNVRTVFSWILPAATHSTFIHSDSQTGVEREEELEEKE